MQPGNTSGQARDDDVIRLVEWVGTLDLDKLAEFERRCAQGFGDAGPPAAVRDAIERRRHELMG